MPNFVPISVSDLKTQVQNLLSHTRAATDSEIIQALNYGVGKASRAIASVRTQYNLSWIDNFTIPAGTSDVDLSTIEPQLWRPVRLLIPANTAASAGRSVRFRYRSIANSEFEDREISGNGGGTFSTLFYDILSGLFPATTTTVQNQVSATVTDVVDPTLFALGQLISVLGSGPLQSIAGTAAQLPTTYYGIVTAINLGNGQITVQPPFTTQPPVSTVVTPYRRQIMKLANPPTLSLTGRLYFQYRAPKFTSLNDVMDPVIAEHRDVVVYYALAQLMQATDDSQATAWFQQAQEMRSELMQDLEPLSGQNSESMDSDLWGVE